MFQHPGQGGVLQLRQFRLAHDPQGQHIHQHQQRQHTEKPNHRGTAHVRAFLGQRRVDAGTFNTDEHKHRDQHHVAHLLRHTAHLRVAQAPDIATEDVGLERHGGNHDKHQQRHNFRHRGDLVDERRLLDPAHHQKMHGPQQHGCTADGQRRITLAEHREKVAEGAEQQHEVPDVAHPRADPVTPGGRKPHVVAKPGLGVGVHAGIQFRLAVGQGLEYEGQGQHADRGDRPADQHSAHASACGHVLRQGKDPTADHRTHHQGDQGTEPKFLRGLGH
ncbi:hypothetical protein [Pseudomonas sp. 24 E 13]|nr:hypothetical protein [Pseudomonas sp. 24 E 13]